MDSSQDRGTYGWIDPFAHQPKPQAPAFEIASTPARVKAVVVDFVVLKLAIALTTLAVTGMSMVALAGGRIDEDSGGPAHAARLLAAVAALLYLVVWPMFRHGRTVGRRLAGLHVEAPAGGLTTRIAAHDIIVLALPALMLDPIAVIGLADLAVISSWMLLQTYREPQSEAIPARLLGLNFVEERQAQTR